MIYPSAAGIENQIAGSRAGDADLFAHPGLLSGSTGQTDAKFLKYRHGKSGTVCAVSQAGAAIYIRVADKLQTVGSDCRAVSAPQCASAGTAVGASAAPAAAASGAVAGTAAAAASSAAVAGTASAAAASAAGGRTSPRTASGVGTAGSRTACAPRVGTGTAGTGTTGTGTTGTAGVGAACTALAFLRLGLRPAEYLLARGVRLPLWPPPFFSPPPVPPQWIRLF